MDNCVSYNVYRNHRHAPFRQGGKTDYAADTGERQKEENVISDR